MTRNYVIIWLAALAILSAAWPSLVWAQAPSEWQGEIRPVWWSGFLDYTFMEQSVIALLIGVGLAALIAFHPITPRTVDTLAEADLPKVYMTYAVVGAVIGVLVLRYGMVIGFVIFGIGGLLRFRTTTETTRDTGRLIIVTLIGLCSGLGLPHFALITALFAFGLIYVFDARPNCRVAVKKVPTGQVARAADAYRGVLCTAGCKILSERKSFSKERVEFIFRMPRGKTQESLHAALCAVAPDLRGEVDWEVE